MTTMMDDDTLEDHVNAVRERLRVNGKAGRREHLARAGRSIIRALDDCE